jgi:hypothetical protein
MNSSKQSHRVLTFLPGVWIRSSTTSRLDLDLTKDRAVWRRRSWTHSKARIRQQRRSQSQCYSTIHSLSPRFEMPLWQNTQPRTVQVEDLVLCWIQKTDGCPKLLNPWEGPFIISRVTGPGSYELMTEDGVPVKNSWHISQLRRFYA